MRRVPVIIAVVLGAWGLTGGLASAVAPGAKHPGNLDRSFAARGRFSIGGDPDAVAFAFQAFTTDGSVIEAGMAQTRTPSARAYPVVMKLTPTGAPDPAFGTAGRFDVPIDPYPSMDATAMTVDRRGRILLGIFGSQAIPGHYFNGLVRLKPDGTLDTRFGDHGRAVVDLPSTPEFIRENGDGSLDVVSNWGATEITIVRFAKNGVPVSTFGSNGIVTLTPLTHQAFLGFTPADLGDGTTLLFEQSPPVVRRVLADGSYDPNFGTGGTMQLATPVTPFERDSKGYEVRSSNAGGQPVVQRVLAGGTFDPTFAGAGDSITIANAAAKIVAHHGAYFYGFVQHGNGNDIVRFTANGQPDPGFGNAGAHFFAKPTGANYYYSGNVGFDPFDRIYAQQVADFGYVDLIEVTQSDVYRLFGPAS